MKKENEDEEEIKEDSEIKTSVTIDTDKNTAECGKDEIENNDSLSKKKAAVKKKHEEINLRNRKVMTSTLALLQCNDINELSELALAAISVLDNEERGSLSDKKRLSHS